MADISIDRFTRQVQDLTSTLENLESRMSSLSGGGNASSPGTFTGSMNRGRFGSGVNFLQNSMGTLGTAMGSLATGATATSMLLPDVGTGMAREAVFYETGLRTGSRMSRDDMGAAVGGNVMPYLSFAGADAVSAGILASGGVLPGSTAMGSMGGGGLFELAARTSSNLTGLFNVDTDKAAASQAQFYSGGTAASLLRAGVFSRDPNTGEQLSQTQIFDQLANRLIRRDLSAEELGEELRSGMLGQQIQSLPFDEVTKDMFTTFLFERSEGRVADFSDQEYIDSAIGRSEDQGFRNIYREESEMQRTESDRLDVAKDLFYDGAKEAFESLTSLKEASDPVTESFGKLNGYLQTIFGDRLGQGALIAGSSGQAAAGAAVLGGLGIATGVFGSIVGTIADEGADNALFTGLLKTGQDILNLLDVGEDGGIEKGTVLSSANVISPDYTGELKVTSPYGAERSTGPHGGIDISAERGTEVTAVKAGKVVKSTTGSGARSYGKYVKVQHDDGYYSLYAHLDSRLVQEDEYVAEGQPIGTVGDTGYATGVHLHFEARNPQDNKINPSIFLESNTGGGFEAIGDVPIAVKNNERSRAGNNISIHVNVQQASEAEAIRLAQIVKRELQKNDMNERMASR